MIIKSITLNNYRLYEGENTIVFETPDDRNICLISGENGFGKTTFLHSLIWCLYGRLITEVEAEVRKDIANKGYNTFLKSNMNNNARSLFEKLSDESKDQIKRRGYTPENEHLKSATTYFVSIEFADVVIPSLPCTSLKVIRSYDMITEKESVDILIDGVKNELTAEIGSEVFINDFILNKDIARFFFFDSEQIVALAETNTSAERKRLCSAYNEVLGVRKYEDLKHNLENVRLRFRKKSSDVESRERLIHLLDKQEQLAKSIEDIKQQTLLYEQELASLKTEDESLQLQLMREGNSATTTEIQRLQSVISAAKQKDEEYKKQLKTFIDYAPFAISGKLFMETREQLVHDHNLSEARNLQLSKNLIVSDITIDLLKMLSNIALPQETSITLQEEIQTILGKYKDEIADEETLLSLSDNDYEEFIAVYNNVTTTYKAEFEHLADDYRKNRQLLERNSRRLSNINSKESDELIKSIRSKKNEIESCISEKEIEIRSSHENLGTITQEHATVSKQVSELSKKVSLDDSDEKKDKVAEQLINELSTFLISLKQEKKFSLERRIKGVLNNLMHKEDFIGSVEVIINGEDMDIELYTVDDKLISKDSLSKGEQQLYATSILKALVDESGIQFPVFIDSPLQKFDKSHATKIITEFYPQISKQVVLFPLLYKELTADEYKVMKPLVNATYLIKNDTTHSYFEKVDINDFITE
ncbi:MAG: DNA sulfur modification protein DndD [Bacteroidaceae bacterium]|nr:DNA sulfur modification protein DndD [Bacteroidaceae bacterium]